jgi:DNA-binding SARP family transcriptional activator
MTTRTQIINAALALATLLCFAVGLPWINLATGGHPDVLVPNSWPDLSDPGLLQQAWEALRWSFLDGSLWLWMAHTALWLVWMIGLVWIVLDVVRFLRLGLVMVRHASRPRVWVSSLVAAVLVVVLAGTANADLAQQAPAVATAVDHRADSSLRLSPAMQPVTVEVQPGESLSSIAHRVLGDRARWPELWEQNRDVVQADGRALTNPNFIRPRWKLVAYIPAPAAVPAPPSPPPEPPAAAPTTSAAPEPTAPPQPDHEQDQDAPAAPGVDLTTGAYVSLAVAAAVAAALASVRIWRRRRYRVGSGDREDLSEPIAPAVRDLHAAYDDRADDAPNDNAGSIPLGVRDSQELALDLATSRGLGLVGDGAIAAARALVLHALAARKGRVIVPEPDLRKLLDDYALDGYPNALIVVPTLADALDELESNAMIQLVDVDDSAPAQLLVATSAGQQTEANLASGVASNTACVLIGPWGSENTVKVHGDGTVVHQGGVGPAALAGSRLYNVPADDLRDLLVLLQQVEAIEAEKESTVSEPAADVEPSPVATKNPEARPLFLNAFGRVQLTWHQDDSPQDITELLTAKQREVLVYLALRPDGGRREDLNKAVWPGSPSVRPYNSLHTAMSVIRKSLGNATEDVARSLILHEDGCYRLNEKILGVDVWQLSRELENAATSAAEASAAADRLLAIYRDELAIDLRPIWLEAPREAMRRDVLDFLGRLARSVEDPERALDLLEQMRKLDSCNESIYQEVIRVQIRLGRPDAVKRTLGLLRKSLEELGLRPGEETLRLVESVIRDNGPAH